MASCPSQRAAEQVDWHGARGHARSPHRPSRLFHTPPHDGPDDDASDKAWDSRSHFDLLSRWMSQRPLEMKRSPRPVRPRPPAGGGGKEEPGIKRRSRLNADGVQRQESGQQQGRNATSADGNTLVFLSAVLFIKSLNPAARRTSGRAIRSDQGAISSVYLPLKDAERKRATPRPLQRSRAGCPLRKTGDGRPVISVLIGHRLQGISVARGSRKTARLLPRKRMARTWR